MDASDRRWLPGWHRSSDRRVFSFDGRRGIADRRVRVRVSNLLACDLGARRAGYCPPGPASRRADLGCLRGCGGVHVLRHLHGPCRTYLFLRSDVAVSLGVVAMGRGDSSAVFGGCRSSRGTLGSLGVGRLSGHGHHRRFLPRSVGHWQAPSVSDARHLACNFTVTPQSGVEACLSGLGGFGIFHRCGGRDGARLCRISRRRSWLFGACSSAAEGSRHKFRCLASEGSRHVCQSVPGSSQIVQPGRISLSRQ